jgi:hypothetical protein
MKQILTLLLLVMPVSFLTADIDISGYFENRFFLVEHTDASWKNFKEKFDLGDYNRLRLILKASPSKKVTVNAAVDFFSFHGIMTSPLGTYENAAFESTEKNSVKIDLDRAYIDLYFKKFDLSVGKQRLAVGVSYLWAPLDIFNRVNVLEPKEEKPGANALKLYVPLGSASSVTCILSPDEDFVTSRSGIRLQTQVIGVDAALTFIRSGDVKTSIYGLDLRGENLIGWWIEAGYFVSPLKKDKKIVLGFDYTFPLKRGLYWLNEYYYDSSGEREISNYDFESLLYGQRFTLGRTYFFSMLRYGFSDFLSASVSYIGNWGDGSYYLSPTLQYEIGQNILVSSGLYITMGNKQGEFNSSNRNIFFIWLKVNF